MNPDPTSRAPQENDDLIEQVCRAHEFWSYEAVADEVNRLRPEGSRPVSTFDVVWVSAGIKY